MTSREIDIYTKKTSLTSSRDAGLICLYPFYFMQIFYENVHTCCPDWTKHILGDIKKQSIEEIWNSDTARYIRRQMYSGAWEKICNPCCPILSQYRATGRLIAYDNLEKFDVLSPELISEIRDGKAYLESQPTCFKIDNANACNINCIMCTRNARSDDESLIMSTAERVSPYLPRARVVVLCGSGEPLAIKHTRNLLMKDFSSNKDLKFNLITNALLLPQFWDKIKHQRFGEILISIDAATKETYENIRVGGKWEVLLESLSLIKKCRHKFERITINMSVMRENYREIPLFINLARAYDFNVSFHRLRGMFGNQNIFEMNDCISIQELRDIIQEEERKRGSSEIFWGDLVEFAVMDTSKSGC